MLTIDGITFSYNSEPTLSDLSFSIGRGEMCAVLGNNGAGKSTLMKCILGILKPSRGAVFIDGEEASTLTRIERARRMGYVPQGGGYLARLTVFDVVLMGRRPHMNWGPGQKDLQVVHEVITTLGLEGLSMRYLDQLSGGELQKVILARALAQEPGIMLLDEPTSNLDLHNQLDVMSTVSTAVRDRGLSAIIAIHDINLALRFAGKFIMLRGGRILAMGGHEVINGENIEKIYGVKVTIEEVAGRKVVLPL